MSTRGAATGGLSAADVERIRESLAAGRKPKVMFTEAAGQIAGEVGQVVTLTDPEQSDEWVVVRFGRDELPFAPTDLVVPPRGRGKRAAPAQRSTTAAAAAPEPKSSPTPDPEPSGKNPAKSPAKASATAATPAPATSAAASSSGPAKRTAKSARTTKPKPPAALTVTLAYQAGEWTVGAHQGSKVLAKPYLVRPADALKMVAMLDVPGVHDAVEAIVSAELTEASQRAERLRDELAEVEARLAELRDAG